MRGKMDDRIVWCDVISITMVVELKVGGVREEDKDIGNSRESL